MVAVNPAGPTAFGNIQGPSNPDGTVLIDTVDGMPALYPGLKADGSGNLVPFVIDPKTVVDTAGLPSQNAIIVELRCITNLLAVYLGDKCPDLQLMRAEEIFNTMVSTGSVP